eukprot:GFUD01051625.1.p1 GENE.GFUD01051625.1~~GFUD01051625.1.p1  ORF type:complete len:216 (+),score=62.55 GFUD01051625.1:134-781(+)
MKYLIITLVVINCSYSAARIIFQEQEQEQEQTQNRKIRKIVGAPNNISTYCPDDVDWCNEPLNYPENTILKAVVKQKKSVKIMFNNDKIPVEKANDTIIGLRSSILESQFENICDVETEYIMPRAAKNKEGKFMFIVNHPEGADEYIQLVRIATCISAGEECGQGRLANSVSTKCNQEYLDHKLVALSATGEELVVDTFTFPSCCTCLMNTGLEL